MGVVRHTLAASASRQANVDVSPYSGRPGTGRHLQPKHTVSGHSHYQSLEQLLSPRTHPNSPILFSSSALSPGAVSWVSVDSSQTGTSYHLGRKREVSAAFYTPTSSPQPSPGAVPDNSSQSRQFWADHHQYNNQYQAGFPHDPSVSPPVALRGLGLPLEENQFSDPRDYPPHNVEVITYHTSSPPSRQPRPGVRWRPLSTDARENAGAVRDSGGSCIRCFIMREKCDAEIPCARCQTVSARARSWKLPCSRKWLNERGSYLVPDVLSSSLNIQEVDDFVNNSSFFALEGSRLRLPLSIGFGQPLVLECVEVDPMNANLTTMQAFAAGPINIKSPPIIPCGPVNHKEIYSKVRSWMSELLVAGGDTSWPETLFPEPHHPEWQRQVLELVLENYRSMMKPAIEDTCIITTAFQLSVAVYVMSHVLVVPRAEVPLLYSQLRHVDFQDPDLSPDEHVCPRAVNKVVKAVLMQMVRHLVEKTFEHIHGQLGPKADKQTCSLEQAFTASFLVLTVLAKIQTSVYERAAAHRERGDDAAAAFGMADAEREIHTMEAELTQYVVHLFLLKYRSKKAKGANTARSPSSSSPPGLLAPTTAGAPATTFRDRLLDILRRHRDGIRHADQELGNEFDETWFQKSGVKNITRVLARLCGPLSEE